MVLECLGCHEGQKLLLVGQVGSVIFVYWNKLALALVCVDTILSSNYCMKLTKSISLSLKLACARVTAIPLWTN